VQKRNHVKFHFAKPSRPGIRCIPIMFLISVDKCESRRGRKQGAHFQRAGSQKTKSIQFDFLTILALQLQNSLTDYCKALTSGCKSFREEFRLAMQQSVLTPNWKQNS
jgi:hypothetical protein